MRSNLLKQITVGILTGLVTSVFLIGFKFGLDVPLRMALVLSLVAGLMSAVIVATFLTYSLKSIGFFIKKHRYHSVALALCISFFFVATFANVGNPTQPLTTGNSLTYDELSILPNGYYYERDGKYFINPEHPPLVKVIAALPFWLLDVKQDFVYESDLLQEDYAQYVWGGDLLFKSGNQTELLILSARSMVLFVNTLLMFGLYLTIAKFWSKKAGIVTLLLLTASQFMMAHASLVTVDVMPALLTALSLLWFGRWLTLFRDKKPTRVAFILTAVFTAGALLGKLSAIVLPIVLIIVAVIFFVASHKELIGRRKKYIGKTIAIIAVTGVLIVTFYMFMVRNMTASDVTAQLRKNYPVKQLPVQGLHVLEGVTKLGLPGRAAGEYVNGLLMINNRVKNGAASVYFMGEVHAKGAGPLYFVVLYLTKLQLAFHFVVLIAVCAGMYLIVKKRIRIKNAVSFLNDRPYVIALVLYGIIFGAIAVSSTLQIGLRHVMPVIVIIAILTGFVIDRIIVTVTKADILKPGQLKFIIVILVTAMAISIAKDYPYFISSYNVLGGGVDNGYKVAVDSNYDWSQNLKRLAAWQKKNNVNNLYTDLMINPILPREYYLGPDVKTYRPWADSALEPGSYVAISLDRWQAEMYGTLPGGQVSMYKKYDMTQVDRIGKTILIYRINGL